MHNIVYDVTSCGTPDPDPQTLIIAMRETATLLGCTVQGVLPAAFQPHGTTAVVVLAESHLTVTTWPEFGMAFIDLFTCRADVPPDEAIAPILAALDSQTFGRQEIRRTTLPALTVVAATA